MNKELLQRGVSTALRWWKSMYASASELKKEGIQAAPTAWKQPRERGQQAPGQPDDRYSRWAQAWRVGEARTFFGFIAASVSMILCSLGSILRRS